jgi:hypothetical protein
MEEEEQQQPVREGAKVKSPDDQYLMDIGRLILGMATRDLHMVKHFHTELSRVRSYLSKR